MVPPFGIRVGKIQFFYQRIPYGEVIRRTCQPASPFPFVIAKNKVERDRVPNPIVVGPEQKRAVGDSLVCRVRELLGHKGVTEVDKKIRSFGEHILQCLSEGIWIGIFIHVRVGFDSKGKCAGPCALGVESVLFGRSKISGPALPIAHPVVVLLIRLQPAHHFFNRSPR
jgi:hypothetical protein